MSVLPTDRLRNPSAIKRTPTKQRVGAVWLGGDGVVVVVRRRAWRPARPRVWATGGRSFARASILLLPDPPIRVLELLTYSWPATFESSRTRSSAPRCSP